MSAAFGNRQSLVERLVQAIAASESITVTDTSAGLVLIGPTFRIPILALTDKRVLGATVTLVENRHNPRLVGKSLADLRTALAELASTVNSLDACASAG